MPAHAKIRLQRTLLHQHKCPCAVQIWHSAEAKAAPLQTCPPKGHMAQHHSGNVLQIWQRVCCPSLSWHPWHGESSSQQGNFLEGIHHVKGGVMYFPQQGSAPTADPDIFREGLAKLEAKKAKFGLLLKVQLRKLILLSWMHRNARYKALAL